MHPSVVDALVPFNSPLEGCVPWLYQDVKGLVTCAIGYLADPMSEAMVLPWTRIDGSPATQAEIATAWLAVKGDPYLAQQGHRPAARLTTIRLSHEGIAECTKRKADAFERALIGRFPEWDTWPADAQLATLALAWACGASFRFPKLQAALLAQNWPDASWECTIDASGNPGIIARNREMRRCYNYAQESVDNGSPIEDLYWMA